jgi:hypothetical protein
MIEKTSRRGAVEGQVFIYILAIVIVGLLLLFGYKGLSGILKQGCGVEEVQFKTGLETMLKQSMGKGTRTVFQPDVPCSFSKVCFVDADVLLTGKGNLVDFDSNPGTNKYVRNSVEDSVHRNVFLINPDGTINSRQIFIDSIEVKQELAPIEVVCISQRSGKFPLLLSGLGKYVKIDEAQPEPAPASP